MEEKLITHEVINTPRPEDVFIQFTDIKLHTNMKETRSHGGKIEKSYNEQKEGRIVFDEKKISFEKNDIGQEILSIPFIDMEDIGFMEFVKKMQEQGKRVFIQKPKDIDVKLGNDAVEFMNSKKGKRILRKINKDK